MALSQNQPKVGTQHGKSPADEVSRTGRDSFLKKSGSIGQTREVSKEDVARTGRDSGTGPVGPAKGIGRGDADSGGGDAARLPADGVGAPFPSP